MVVKVLSASFQPEVIEHKATKDVEWLPGVEALYECDHAGNVRWFPGVVVASFSDIAKERGVPEGRGGAPVPLSWVPWEILNKPSFKNPVEWRLLARSFQVLGYFEGRLKSLLR
ncbi:unnamed protein product [Sphagnum jensenii]|uniref:Uncharacterized protein n=1 Tax=Sphagnum jensenii TaxID=128206 RepID=A0ABP1ABE5_9BRYO